MRVYVDNGMCIEALGVVIAVVRDTERGAPLVSLREYHSTPMLWTEEQFDEFMGALEFARGLMTAVHRGPDWMEHLLDPLK